MVDDQFHVYDTTLRDGAQQEGLNLTVADKLVIARHLDRLGVGFIEGGWPGAIPKDTEFFRRAQTELELGHATLAAFGSTRKAGVKAADDPQVAALRESRAPVVTLVAKSHDRHVELALRTTLDENLAMIADTVKHLTTEGQRVFVDAEHFFDGYRANPAYALECVRAAAEAGADVIALCDTNGGMMPTELGDVVQAVAQATQARLGIHCHDDTGCGVANTLVAVEAGVTHVQGTANGYGERAGNANLFSVVAGLQLKKGSVVLEGDGIREMARIAHAISEVTNVTPDTHQPYVGFSAFAHKAGLHASAIRVDPMLYQHIDPALVGNDMRMLVSDMAGRASVELKGRELGFDLSRQQGGDRPGHQQGQGARGARLFIRGGRRELRAAAPRRAGGRAQAALHGRILAGDRRAARGFRWGNSHQRGDGPAGRQGRAGHRRRRGQRTGERARPRAAVGPRADLPRARHPAADRLQGPHPGGHRPAPGRSPGCWSNRATAAATPGPPSGWTRTSSPRPGTHSKRRSATASSGPDVRPTDRQEPAGGAEHGSVRYE